jgi:superfamily II DNA/RNA helicase
VDKIFEAMKSAGGTCQTILFSATLPPWVKKVTQKYMKSNKLTVDLVENEVSRHTSRKSFCKV